MRFSLNSWHGMKKSQHLFEIGCGEESVYKVLDDDDDGEYGSEGVYRSSGDDDGSGGDDGGGGERGGGVNPAPSEQVLDTKIL